MEADNEETISECIIAEDFPHFEITDLSVTTTHETELVATLNAFTKSTNRGYFYLLNQKRVCYKFAGDDPSNLQSIFGNYDAPVKIRCYGKAG